MQHGDLVACCPFLQHHCQHITNVQSMKEVGLCRLTNSAHADFAGSKLAARDACSWPEQQWVVVRLLG